MVLSQIGNPPRTEVPSHETKDVGARVTSPQLCAPAGCCCTTLDPGEAEDRIQVAQSEERGWPPTVFTLSVKVCPSKPETKDDRGWGLITP